MTGTPGSDGARHCDLVLGGGGIRGFAPIGIGGDDVPVELVHSPGRRVTRER